MHIDAVMPKSEAREIAKAVAERLRAVHRATRVVLFGSSADEDGVYDPKASDIDIYFEGVPRESCLRAAADCLFEFGEFDRNGRKRMDILAEPFCTDEMRHHIFSTGTPL